MDVIALFMKYVAIIFIYAAKIAVAGIICILISWFLLLAIAFVVDGIATFIDSERRKKND